jgi:hypothetical protein
MLGASMEPSTSRLFRTIVLMGCALGPMTGCLEKVPENACPPVCPTDGGPGDMTMEHPLDYDGGDHDGGWPPTK